jgi:hypothetical protein
MRKCEANIRFEVNIGFEANIRFKMCFLHQIEYLYVNLCEYFEANMKRILRIVMFANIPKYEANKFHIRLDLLRSE